MSGICLVRHGETATPGLFLGRSDPPLSDRGREQAKRIAVALKRPRTLLSSSLRRAVETAEILGQAWGMAPVIDSRLNEIGYGAWDGLSWGEIEQRWPSEAEAKLNNWWGVIPPGGEATHSFVERLQAAHADLLNLERPVVIVAHVGVNALLAQLARDCSTQEPNWSRVTTFTQDLGQWIEV